MKSKILGLLAVGLIAGPLAAEASVVSVWDTFDPDLSAGMSIGAGGFGASYRQGIAFQPSASGYLYDFTIEASRSSGAGDWLFTLRADVGNLPTGAVLETFAPLVVGSTPDAYTVSASGATLLTAGVTYWLMAEIPDQISGGTWFRILNGSGTRAFCDLVTGCGTYTALTDTFAGAARIRVQTVSAVPEPGTLALLGLGLAGLGLSRRRKAN